MQVAATPRGLPDPGPPPTPEKTLSRWGQFLGSIAAGVLLPDAMKKHFISRSDIEAAIRSSDEERTRWDEARIAALKRGWSAFDFDDIFERIAGGMPITEAIVAVKGDVGGSTYSAFNRIIVADSILCAQYERALKARTLCMPDEILAIADDITHDVLYNDKGPLANTAAVNRSKLRVETRTRLMGAWNTKMYGETKNQVQVNVQVNHAQKLEEARSRASTRSPGKIPAKVIEAAFKDIPVEIPPPPKLDLKAIGAKREAERAAQDTSWLDAPAPLDTSWLEGP